LLAAGGALAAAGLVAWRIQARQRQAAASAGGPSSPLALWRRKVVLALAAAGALFVLLFVVWAEQNPELRRGGLPERLAETVNPYSPSIRHRLGLLAVTSRIIADHPLLGVGPGRYGWAYGETQARLAREEQGVGFWALGDVMTGNFVGEAHCDPLQWWAEDGLAAPLGLALMLAGALAGAAWTLRGRGEGSAAGAACWAALASFAINMWVAFPLERPVRALTFWALLGLVAGLAARNAECKVRNAE
jgi:O-antigen ligase